MAYMPMFLSIVITFPEFVAVLSVRESSSSPALSEQTVLSFGLLATGGGSYTSSAEEEEEEVLLHFLVTEPAVVGSYPTTALSQGLSPLSAVFPRHHMIFP